MIYGAVFVKFAYETGFGCPEIGFYVDMEFLLSAAGLVDLFQTTAGAYAAYRADFTAEQVERLKETWHLVSVQELTVPAFVLSNRSTDYQRRSEG